MPQKNSGGRIGLIIVVVIIIIGLLAMCSSGGGSSSSSSSKGRTCKSCGRTFTDSSNTMNIAKTGMCNNCYSNFQWGQKALGK